MNLKKRLLKKKKAVFALEAKKTRLWGTSRYIYIYICFHKIYIYIYIIYIYILYICIFLCTGNEEYSQNGI